MRRTVGIENGIYENGDAPALMIVGHGSRDPRGVREFHDLVGLVRRRIPSLMVEGGFIELSSPPISECVDRLAEGGVSNVAAVPLMLLAAGHAKDDIPATLVREKMGHPRMTFAYGRALGIRPELLELMEERTSAVVNGKEKEETAVLVVGRGSSDPDANSDLSKIARLFYEGRPYPVVESAYVSMTPPDVEEGLDRCFKLGAKRIVVFSYFLFTGILEERIREQCRAFAAATRPGIVAPAASRLSAGWSRRYRRSGCRCSMRCRPPMAPCSRPSGSSSGSGWSGRSSSASSPFAGARSPGTVPG